MSTSHSKSIGLYASTVIALSAGMSARNSTAKELQDAEHRLAEVYWEHEKELTVLRTREREEFFRTHDISCEPFKSSKMLRILVASQYALAVEADRLSSEIHEIGHRE